MNEIDTMAILKRTYVRYYGNVGDKSYGKKYINMWNTKMRLLNEMYSKIIRFNYQRLL